MTRLGLYLLAGSGTAAGYAWLAINLSGTGKTNIHACLFRQLTGIPCPSCGSTRSVQHLIHGRISEAMMLNPLGIIIALLMLVLPVWIGYDLIFRRSTFFQAFLSAEQFLKAHRLLAVFLLILILFIWIHNIYLSL